MQHDGYSASYGRHNEPRVGGVDRAGYCDCNAIESPPANSALNFAILDIIERKSQSSRAIKTFVRVRTRRNCLRAKVADRRQRGVLF